MLGQLDLLRYWFSGTARCESGVMVKCAHDLPVKCRKSYQTQSRFRLFRNGCEWQLSKRLARCFHLRCLGTHFFPSPCPHRAEPNTAPQAVCVREHVRSVVKQRRPPCCTESTLRLDVVCCDRVASEDLVVFLFGHGVIRKNEAYILPKELEEKVAKVYLHSVQSSPPLLRNKRSMQVSGLKTLQGS